LFPFDMETRTFPDQGPFDPPRQPPKRRPGRPRHHSSPGKFSVEEVPFFEVVEIELPEGE
jgi:hypothetical protein